MPETRVYRDVFFRHGVSTAMLYWLIFQQSIDTKKPCLDATPNLHIPTQASLNVLSDTELLSVWLRAQKGSDLAYSLGIWLVPAIGAGFGIAAILGACSYAGQSPINLWVMLGMFSLLPLILTLIAALSWRRILSEITDSTALPWWSILLNQYVLAPVLGGEFVAKWRNSRSLHLWALWKMQSMAIAFQVSAICGFLVILLFKDLAFGWSSTLVNNGNTMASIFQIIAWPWHWIVAVPSQEVIEQAQFYRGAATHFDAAVLGRWWVYIVMAMLTYGLLPRALLIMTMRYQLKKVLTRDIRMSGHVEYCLRSLRESLSVSGNPKGYNEIDNANGITEPNTGRYVITLSRPDTGNIITWQWQAPSLSVESSLGLSSWETDEAWINMHAPAWRQTHIVLVRLEQTPTAELLDIIRLAQSLNPKVGVELAVGIDENAIVDADNVPNPDCLDALNNNGSFKSWAMFAHKNKLILTVMPLPGMQQSGA